MWWASLGPGAWFGEIALQYKTLRTATIRAHTDGNLYVLHRDDFLKLAAYYPEVYDALKKGNERMIREIAKDRSHTPLAHFVFVYVCVCVCVCVKSIERIIRELARHRSDNPLVFAYVCVFSACMYVDVHYHCLPDSGNRTPIKQGCIGNWDCG